MERYFNDFATTVGVSGYTSGSGVLDVASTSGISLNTSDTCRVAIYDLSGNLVVILIVGAVNSGTQFAVTAETTDTNATAGFPVINVLTVGGFNQLRMDQSMLGPYSSLPAPGSNFLVKGQRFKQTDGPYEFIFDGTIWVPFVNGYKAVLPVSSNYSWVNQGGATVSFAQGLGLLSAPASGSNSMRLQSMAQPSTPFTIEAMVAGDFMTSNSNTGGIGFYDSSGGQLITIHVVGGTAAQYQVITWNGLTSFHGAPATIGQAPTPFLLAFLRIVNDGTNLKFSIGTGVSWYEIHSEAIGSFVTPDSIFFFGNSSDSNPVTLGLLSWYQH